MRIVETDWWTIAIPDEWTAEQDEESILIADDDELGCISLTTVPLNDGWADLDKLRKFVASIDIDVSQAETCQLAELDALYLEGEEEGEFFREWYVCADQQVLMICYSCDPEDQHFDRSTVDEILDSLVLVPVD